MEINQIPGKFEAVRDDISLYCMRAVCDSLIHCVVKFKGHIDFKILQQAVRLSLDAEPVLGCRFIVTKFRPYWERRTDLDECDICSFHESNELDQDINKFLTLQLDPAKDSQVQVRLFRADSDVLCIKVNHMVADAGGVKEYVYLLSEIYQRLLKDPAYKPTINIDGSRSSLQVYKQFGFFKKLHIAWHTFLEWKKNTFPRGNWCMPLANGNLSERTFVIRRLSGKRFKQIREYGKKNQVTINDLIVAAFYRAFYKVIKPAHNTPLRMGATVDLRRYLSTGKGGGIANIAGFFMLNIGKEIGATFAETISLVNRQMRLKKDGLLGLAADRFAIFHLKLLPLTLGLLLTNIILIFNLLLGSKNVPPWLTNMGNIDKQRLIFPDADVEDAFLTAPIAYPPLFVVGLSGFEESLSISIGFCEQAVGLDTVEIIMDSVEENLALLKG